MAKDYTMPDFLGQIHTKPDYIYNYLWIRFTGRKLETIGPFVRSKNAIKASESRIGSWQFIAPNEIMENVSHDWEEFESIGTRAAQKSITMRHAGMEGKQVASAISGVTKSLMNEGNLPEVSSTLGNINKVGVPAHKVDTTLVYKDTKRRAYDLTFEFSFWNETDPEKKIFEPIRELEKWTCPDIDGEFTKINFPAVFNIKTVQSDLINIKYGVITSVQPTWMAPFINGYPSKVSLSISFQDMEPLYRRSW